MTIIDEAKEKVVTVKDCYEWNDRLREIITEMQGQAETQQRALLYETEKCCKAEQDMLKWREEANGMRQELAALKHATPSRIGGTFKRRDRFPREHELVRERMDPGPRDEIVWSWSRAAAHAGLHPGGQFYTMEMETFMCLSHAVRADSWWHLCAKTGLVEGVARLCYEHPEEGQESAVAKAKPVQRGAVIYCQNDEDW
jgi:hypothetical protein